jgi:integrase
VSGVQISVLAYLKTSLCAGFSSFQPPLEFCPSGVSLPIIPVYWGRFGLNLGVKSWSDFSNFALMAKASAGTPQVKNSNGRLQIVITHSGKRKYLSLGVSDSKQNRVYGNMVAARIQNDILAGHFDPTLEKYKRESSLSELDNSTAKDITIRELWTKYTNFKRPQLSPSTIAKDFDRVAKHIDSFPVSHLTDAVAVRDYLNAKTTPNTTKRVLTQLCAACDWAAKSNIITANPFIGMAADIKLPKGNGVEADIDPFSPEERDRIIEYLRSNNNHYASLVEFLFRTGCRPSEAIGLRWKDISPNYKTITFEQAIVVSENGLVVKQGLKTQDKRVFPCGGGLKSFLQSIEPEHKDREQFIFKPKRAKFVDFHNFTNRAWHPALKALGIKERKPYQTRHTFITFCLDSGMDAKDVAKLVGNSAAMIYKHYAGAKRDLIAPDI